jgi:hypothetical protein
MIINNSIRYQSIDYKSKVLNKKTAFDAVSKPARSDSYEPSASAAAETKNKPFRTDIRQDLINTVKKRIDKGFYNSADVMEDLSNSFAKALQQSLL